MQTTAHPGFLSKRESAFETAARLALCAAGLLIGTTGVIVAETTVFAAASLTDALKEIASGDERRTGDKVVFNFGASSFLARQIEAGAPADIYFSAAEAKMDGLEKKGLLVKETRKNLLSNSLVLERGRFVRRGRPEEIIL